MRKSIIAGVAAIAASLGSCAAVPNDASAAKCTLKYGDRLRPLLGKQFGILPDRAVVQQFARGGYELVAVGVDYAEFHSGDNHVLIPLHALRVEILK